MAKTPTITLATLRSSPFFLIEGPDGRQLSCQWTYFSHGSAGGAEFEIVCPETPHDMGNLFGLFEEGEFRMRPSLNVDVTPDPDLAWRGRLGDVADAGHDLEMGPDGLLEIAHVALGLAA